MAETPSALYEAILATTNKFVKSYLDATLQQNAKLLSAQESDDCLRYIGPPAFLAAMGAPKDLCFTQAQYEGMLEKEMELYGTKSYEIFDVTVDTVQRKSSARSVYHGVFSDGVEYDRNLTWFLDFNEDGTKVVKIYQLNDTEEARNYRVKVEGLAGKK